MFAAGDIVPELGAESQKHYAALTMKAKKVVRTWCQIAKAAVLVGRQVVDSFSITSLLSLMRTCPRLGLLRLQRSRLQEIGSYKLLIPFSFHMLVLVGFALPGLERSKSGCELAPADS